MKACQERDYPLARSTARPKTRQIKRNRTTARHKTRQIKRNHTTARPKTKQIKRNRTTARPKQDECTFENVDASWIVIIPIHILLQLTSTICRGYKATQMNNKT